MPLDQFPIAMVAADRLLDKDALQEISAVDAVIHPGSLFRKNQRGLKLTSDDHGQRADIWLLQTKSATHFHRIYGPIWMGPQKENGLS